MFKYFDGFSFFVLLLLFLSSCQPIYRPNGVNQPLMSGQGDVQASAHYGTNGADLQVAGALSDHILLIGNYNRFSLEVDNDSLSDRDRFHRLFEFGGGYYTHLGNGVRSADNSGAVLELLGGYGNGLATAYSNAWTDSERDITGRYHKIFFQPGFGYHHNIFDGGLATRLTAIDYYEVEAHDGSGRLEPTTGSGMDYFLEPVLTGRVGYRFIKFQFQAGLSIPLDSTPLYQHQPFLFSVGLHFDISSAPEG